MSKRLTQFNRPIVRRLPNLNLVVRFSEDGISIRTYRRRKWKRVTWSQIASLSDDAQPIIKSCEEADGRRTLELMGVILNEAGQTKQVTRS